MKQSHEKYCSECGTVISSKAEICPKCGVRQIHLSITQTPTDSQHDNQQNQKNVWITSLVLCWFFGVLGVHRFYTGHIGIGIVQLLTFGGCGIWTLIDFILIVTGNYKDANGNPIRNV